MRSASKTAARKSGRSAPKGGSTETEIKLRIGDRRALLRQLAGLKAQLIAPRVHEMNTLYDTTDGKLARQAQMLRLRVERVTHGAAAAGKRGKSAGISALLTFKGPSTSLRKGSIKYSNKYSNKGSKKGSKRTPKPASGEHYKVREEHELRIADHEEMPRILEALGLRPWFRYEKFRTTYGLPGIAHLKVEFDETPVGLFLEIEGERGAIDRAAELLGFARSDYIDGSYGALFMKQLGLAHKEAPQNEPTPSSGLPDMVFRKSVRRRRRS
jgi:adenylate cyclase class IV